MYLSRSGMPAPLVVVARAHPTRYSGQDLSSIFEKMKFDGGDLGPAVATPIAPAGPPRVGGRRPGRTARRVRSNDPPRCRAAAGSRLSGRFADRAGPRLPAPPPHPGAPALSR